jgi:MerR family mercuric resistance operon transcriptional regulator
LETEVKEMETLTIGQLAKSANVNLETVRYYERKGLLPKPSRNESGYRQYSLNDVKRIGFIKRTQALGFSLKEISELLSLRTESGSTCGDVKRRVDAKIADVEEKMVSLQEIKEALVKLSVRCTGQGPIGECPILETLEN